jgi:hypothetical protein
MITSKVYYVIDNYAINTISPRHELFVSIPTSRVRFECRQLRRVFMAVNLLL